MERNSKLTTLARNLRKNQTKEETLLWYNFLCKCQPRFHRQHVIGNYIVDFYCHKAKLVIELDGSQHFEDAFAAEDKERDTYLASLGLRVLRIPNNEISRNFCGVCEHIYHLLQRN